MAEGLDVQGIVLEPHTNKREPGISVNTARRIIEYIVLDAHSDIARTVSNPQE